MDKNLMNELEHEIQFLAPGTQRQYRAHVYDYLQFVGKRDWRDRQVLYAYMDKLKKEEKAQNYINNIVRGAIGSLFRMNGLRTPVKLPRAAPAMIDLSTRFSYSLGEISALIRASRESGKDEWKVVMALSSVYGLRTGEIRGVKTEDANLKSKTLVIHTLKGGMKREHLVPKEIEFVLHYPYPAQTENHLYDLFHDIAREAGVKYVPRKCFHGVRHGLCTILENLRDGTNRMVLDKTRIYQFLRWKGGGMMEIYATPRMFDVDEEIFQHHPFLKDWE